MLLDTFRFGQIEVDDEKIITFKEGLPGFEKLCRFSVVTPEDTRPIYWLQSVEDRHIALPVIDTFEVLPDYSLEVDDSEIADLQIEGMEDLIVLNVAVIPEDIDKMTVNLAAPILINVRLGLGMQILVDNKALPVRYPVFEDIYKLLKGEKEGQADAGTVEKD